MECRGILDSQQNDECIDFTVVCITIFFLSSPFGAVKMLPFYTSASLVGK